MCTVVPVKQVKFVPSSARRVEPSSSQLPAGAEEEEEEEEAPAGGGGGGGKRRAYSSSRSSQLWRMVRGRRSCIRQHASAYVSVLEFAQLPALADGEGSKVLHTSACVSIRQHTSAYVTQLRRCRYWYFCTSNASKLSTRRQTSESTQLRRCQYWYFCTSTFVLVMLVN